MRSLLALALAASVLAASPLSAAESAWVELAPDVRARLIAGETRSRAGTTLAGLEIEMPESTNTYWRVPGETGIPAEIDIAGSAGVTGAEILWPYPRVETANGYLDYVYRGHTVLPIELAVESDAPVLRASITLGLCSDICVPAMASFELPLDLSTPDRGHGLRLLQALAVTPVPWQERHDAIASLTLDPAADALAVRLGDPQVDWTSLIADMGPHGQLFGAPQKSPDDGTILLPLLGGGDPAGLAGKPVSVTFRTPMGPFETSRPIELSPATKN